MSVKWERVAFLDSAAPCAGGKLCEKREVRIDCCPSHEIVGRFESSTLDRNSDNGAQLQAYAPSP